MCASVRLPSRPIGRAPRVGGVGCAHRRGAGPVRRRVTPSCASSSGSADVARRSWNRAFPRTAPRTTPTRRLRGSRGRLWTERRRQSGRSRSWRSPCRRPHLLLTSSDLDGDRGRAGKHRSGHREAHCASAPRHPHGDDVERRARSRGVATSAASFVPYGGSASFLQGRRSRDRQCRSHSSSRGRHQRSAWSTTSRSPCRAAAAATALRRSDAKCSAR